MRGTTFAALALLCSGCLKPRTCLELYTCPPDGERSDAASEVSDGLDGGPTRPDGGVSSDISTSGFPDAMPPVVSSDGSAPIDSETHEHTSTTPDASSGVCGDGQFNAGEVCDDGNTDDEVTCAYGDAECIACNATCTATLSLTGPTCGDGKVSDGEACDEDATWCEQCRVVPVVAAGGQHSCALLDTGGVKCWGQDVAGQLGNGLGDNQKTAVGVQGLSSGVRAIVAGSLHTCALTMTGGVKCWGDGSYGQVGDGTTTTRRTPVDVNGLESGVTALAGGNLHTCALLSTGGVRCWGHGASGTLGNGEINMEPAPVDVLELSDVKAISAGGGSHTCALTKSDGVFCWGSGTSGQLGNGATDNEPTPVPVTGLDSGVVGLAAGGQHTCALLQAGTAQCWGFGESGQLGDGRTTSESEPVSVVGLDDVNALAAGSHHTCAIAGPDRRVSCWGKGDMGQLGSDEVNDELQPTEVSGLQDVRAIAAGSQHSCALLSDGNIRCWGRGDNGQLGTGKSVNELTPVTVVGLR